MLINQLRHPSLHKAAKILRSCSRSEAVSVHFQTLISNTSDSSSRLFHFRCSSSHPFPNGMKLMAISKICVSAYKYKKTSKIQVIDASQAAKSLAQKTVLLISKKGASCVSFGDRLLRLVPWATEFEHHLAQNLGKAHLPKSMKSRSFAVESYEFTLSNKNKSVFVFAQRLSCSMPALENLTHQPAEALFTSQGSQDLVKLLPHWGSVVSLSDLNIKCKWQFIISTLVQMFFKWSLAKWSHMNGISIRLMAISEQQKIACVPVFAHKYHRSSEIKQINASKAAKSLAEKTVLLPCKLRKVEPSLHAPRKSLPSSGSDHLLLEMISMSQGYDVQVVGSWRLFALKVPCTSCFLGQ